MSDATTHGHSRGHNHGHSHGHDHGHDHDHAADVAGLAAPRGSPPRPAPAGFSLIEASAGGRLLPALLALAALWAGVYWALH